MNHSANNTRIKQFIKKSIGYEVDETTILFSDFGLVGDDACHFILSFCKEFEIDASGLVFSDYFIDEYHIPFLYWYDKFFRKEKLKRKEFGLKHLEEIVKAKKWIDV